MKERKQDKKTRRGYVRPEQVKKEEERKEPKNQAVTSPRKEPSPGDSVQEVTESKNTEKKRRGE